MNDRIVLVVDDDPAIRELMVELLDEAGYRVLAADFGKQGLGLAQEFIPSVVLVNHSLPDMSGLDLLERLRARPATKRIPVVLVTGRSPQPGQAGGADRILPMPFDIDVLLTHVEQLTLESRGSVA